MNNYRVSLWQTRLAALPVDTLDIEATTPRHAAIIALQTHGVTAMGVVVVMSEGTSTSVGKQVSFFDAEWCENYLYFSQEQTYPRLSPQHTHY